MTHASLPPQSLDDTAREGKAGGTRCLLRLLSPVVLAIALAGCGAAADSLSANDTAPITNNSSVDYAFPELTGRVVDQADLLDPDQEAALSARSEMLERTTGHQLVIVTLASLGDHSINDYGLALGNHWGIGRKESNDGVLLIVAPNERKVRIEVGYGLEAQLTDAEAADIIDTAILPAFRDGDFPRGIAAGTDGIIAEIGETE
ncbi:TPM domain-containing protein [Sphingosinithalassobacter portus]|uniref:TPM domain-containing protein n=1 Tax=Stakelama portus TaxID=2676234 RepID=UPI000D6E5F12|nr:TPM domain-containing protein [Sphingosinithalassobacter portus]